MIWFSADYHFNHPNILKYASRPFRDIEHMHKRLIANHNARVKDEDDVYHIGDFVCLGNDRGTPGLNIPPRTLERQLNGKIIHIRGNHDRTNGLKNTIQSAELFLGGKRLLLIHKPPMVVNRSIDIVLCGHVHNNWACSWCANEAGKSIPMVNVGVDVNRYMPITISEILNTATRWKKNVSGGVDDARDV